MDGMTPHENGAPRRMDLLTENPVYKPFRYPWAYEAWLTQQRVHWLPEEVPLADDVKDWHRNLTDAERNLLLIKGAVPGPNGGLLEVRNAIKG